MKSSFTSKVVYVIAIGALVAGFQNCTSNFATLTENGALSSNIANNLSADAFRVTKDASFDQSQLSCPEPEYKNFKCLNKVLRTQEGLEYPVTFRWNRAGMDSAGTVIWVLGGSGRGKWRTMLKEAIPIQDDFNQNKRIRSVEIDFSVDPVANVHDGGYWIHGGGYYSAGQAYMAAVAYVTANLKSGAFMNHVGGSNGSAVPAYALSHFNAGQFVDRFIFHAGPFLPSLQDACNTSHYASFSINQPNVYNTIIGMLGSWTYRDSKKNVCADSTGATANRLSLLNNALKSYPLNAIHVVMGEKERTEGFGDWIIESNLSWYSQIQAAEKTREVLPQIGHEMHWASVANYAYRGKPGAMGAAPSLTFSTSLNGPAVSTFAMNTTVYGVVRGIDSASAQACMAESTRISDCDNPHNWSAFPNAEWTYDGSAWRSTFTPSQLGVTPGKTYVGFNINTRTGQRTPLVSLTITADPAMSSPAAVAAAISEGLFMKGAGIYYSNGSAYCQFDTMANFTKITGRTNATGIRQVSSIPTSMRNDGICVGR